MMWAISAAVAGDIVNSSGPLSVSKARTALSSFTNRLIRLLTDGIPFSPDSFGDASSVGEARDLRQWSVAGLTRSSLPVLSGWSRERLPLPSAATRIFSGAWR